MGPVTSGTEREKVTVARYSNVNRSIMLAGGTSPASLYTVSHMGYKELTEKHQNHKTFSSHVDYKTDILTVHSTCTNRNR